MAEIQGLTKSLKNHAVAKGEKMTHTSMGPPYGNYNYTEDEYNDLYRLVHYNAFTFNQPVYLTEVGLGEYNDVKIDIDLRYITDKVNARKYEYTFVRSITMMYIDWLRNVIDAPEELFKAFVLERDGPYTTDNVLKDGFHIQFPYLRTKTYIQHLMRIDIIQECKRVFSNIGTINNWDDIIDKCVIDKNNWLMYGCRKPSRAPYRLTHILDIHGQEMDKSVYSDLDLIGLLSIRKPNTVSNVKDNMEEKMYQRWLEMNPKDKPKVSVKNISLNGEARVAIRDHELEMVPGLVNLLNIDRCDNYQQWIQVGWCLYNISDTLLDTWKQWSQKSIKYDESVCEQEWNKMEYRVDGLGIGSLHLWAKLDNPDEYKRIIQNNKRIRMDKYLDRSDDSSIAEALHIMYGDQYRCCDPDGRVWYYFNGTRWVETKKGMHLRNQISKTFVSEYYSREAFWSMRCAEEEDEAERKRLMFNKEQVSKTAKSLLGTTQKNKIMEEARGLFLDEKFIDRLDSKNNLIGFENGIYDLDEHVFREGKPDDYVSYSVGFNYESVNLERPNTTTKKLLEILSQIFPDHDVFEYTMKFIATGLWGRNQDTLFHFFTGVGSNGKTIVEELIKKSLGDYCDTIQTQMLTKKRAGSQAASPDLIGLKGRRFVLCAEPENTDTITVGFMKLLTGGDNIRARGLYQANEITFKPQCKIVMICNDLPRIESNDMGTWRRIRTVPFVSRFCENPRGPNEFKVDYNLLYTIDAYRESFMGILLHYFKKYIREGLQPPHEVVKYTEEYRHITDIYTEFVDDTIVMMDTSVKPSEYHFISDVYKEFKIWYKEAYPDSKCPTKNDMRTGLERVIGKLEMKGGRRLWSKLSWKRDHDNHEPEDDTNSDNESTASA